VSQEIHSAERQQNTTTTTAEDLWRMRERDLGFENVKKSMEHILILQKTGYGLTLIELRKTAFKFVHRNGIRTTFSTEKGYYRLRLGCWDFKPSPRIIDKKSQVISYRRAMCLNESQLYVFFNAYEPLVQQLDQQTDRNAFTTPMKVDCNIVSYPIKL
jgi:hypothetical protein